MTEVRVAPQRTGAAGAIPTRTGSLSTSDTYLIRNDGKTFISLLKTAAVNCVPTIETPATVGGLAVAEQTVATVVATTGDVIAGPFAPAIFNDSSGDMRITFSDIDGLSIAVIQF